MEWYGDNARIRLSLPHNMAGIVCSFVFTGLLACSTTAHQTPAPPTHVAAASVPAGNNPTAQHVYGQPDFTTGTLRDAGATSLKNPSAIAADGSGGCYVADYGNSRVLHFPAAHGTGAGPAADRVYGQPDFTANAAGHGPNGLNYPHGVVVDSRGELYVADTFNNRVLHYPAGSATADRVYGQGDFAGGQENAGGLSSISLAHPEGISIDSTGLYVADALNNRVLHFPNGSTTADFVYGQGLSGNSPQAFMTNAPGSGDANLNNPRDVAVTPTGIFVADAGNHRVVHFALKHTQADRVYGQPDFAPAAVQPNQGHSSTSALTLNNPTGLATDKAGGLYVADRDNNRVLYYAPGSVNIDPPATRVYGQLDFTSAAAGITARAFHGPGDVATDGAGDLLVLDIFNQRVLKFLSH
jgi:sugar lactone lactonase YvrE